MYEISKCNEILQCNVISRSNEISQSNAKISSNIFTRYTYAQFQRESENNVCKSKRLRT